VAVNRMFVNGQIQRQPGGEVDTGRPILDAP
jgi:hypothetical protein